MELKSIDNLRLNAAILQAGVEAGDEDDFTEILESEIRRAEAEATSATKIDLDYQHSGRPIFTGGSNGAQVQTVTTSSGKKVTVSVSGDFASPSADTMIDIGKNPEAARLFGDHLVSALYDPEQGALVKAAARFKELKRAKNSASLQAQCRAELSKIPRNDLTGRRNQTILKYARMGMDTNGL